MNSQEELNRESQDNQAKKMVWQLPEIMELDINESTLNVTKANGSSVNDGGPGFTDYNS